MFLFDAIPWYSIVMWFVVLGALMLINEIARRNKWFAIFIFIGLPIVLSFVLWPITAGKGSSVSSWFHWAKVYSALAGCIGFLAIRNIPKLSTNKIALLFPPFILALNIAEAVFRDFQAFSANGIIDGALITGGPWNILNGVAGIINIITITGWMGIFISKDKNKDMLWPDMLWFWIIAYDIWNFAYVYNCVGDHSFYAGAALLIACTIPAFFIKKGAWLQHRAQTLGIWMMFVMSFPQFVDTSMFAVKASRNAAGDARNALPLWIISGLALAFNVGVLVFEIITIAKTKKNPCKDDIYSDLQAYKNVAMFK